MRFATVVPFFLLLSIIYPCAFAADNGTSDPLAILEAKAIHAQPKDQCFLYAMLVSRMTEVAGRDMNSGDAAGASAALRQVQQYANRIHQGVGDNSRKLKKAEILIERTSFHLKDILDLASFGDREVVQATLNDLNQIQSQLMMAVFKK